MKTIYDVVMAELTRLPAGTTRADVEATVCKVVNDYYANRFKNKIVVERDPDDPNRIIVKGM